MAGVQNNNGQHGQNGGQNTGTGYSGNGRSSLRFDYTKTNFTRPTNPTVVKSKYSQQEEDRLQIILSKVLGLDYISSRPGGGSSKVSYIEGWKVLNIANEIFGFNGWSSEVISINTDYCDDNGSGRVSVGVSTIVRVTLKDGTFREDIGYGSVDNARSKGAALEKCKKESVTDAMKRCFRGFGNLLGNCLYDKNILSKLKNANTDGSTLTTDDIYHNEELLRAAKERRNRNTVNIGNNPSGTSTINNHINDNNNNTTAPIPPSGPRNNVRAQNYQLNQTNQASGARSAPSIPSTSSSTAQSVPVPVQVVHAATAVTPAPNKATNELISRKTRNSEDDFDDSFLFSDDIEMNKMDEYEYELIMNKENEPEIDDETLEPSVDSGKNNQTPAATVAASVTVPITAATPTGPSVPNAPDVASTVGTTAPLFVSARGADLLKTPGSQVPEFDPKFISPNIRRTLDPTRSYPVKRTELINKTPSKRVGGPPIERAPLKRIHKENMPVDQ